MTFRILNFCGGGARGLFSSRVLMRLQQECPDLIEKADMLAGTSTGTVIIGALLEGKTPAQIHDGYLELIFLNNAKKHDSRKPGYNTRLFTEEQYLHHGTKRLSDFDKKLLMTAFDLGNSAENTEVIQHWGPVLFHNFEGSDTLETPLVISIVASSVFAGMFGPLTAANLPPALTWPSSYNALVDGTVVHHDPALVAIALAVNSGIPLDEISVLTFDTGFMKSAVHPFDRDQPWGAHQWQHRHVPTLQKTMLTNGTPDPALNIFMNGNTSTLLSSLSGMMLGTRYAWLQNDLRDFVAEDAHDPGSIEILEEAANQTDLTGAIDVYRNYW